MTCEHVYARKLDGTRCCVKCTAPKPPLKLSTLRMLNAELQAINAEHAKEQRFTMIIVRGEDLGMTILEYMAEALDELELRRARG